MSPAMDDVALCLKNTTCVSIAFVTVVIAFFVGAKLSDLYPWFFRWLGKGKRNPSCIQRDITDMKETTLKIANEWIKLTKVIQENQDYQRNFGNRMQSYLKTNIETLGKNVIISLEEEFMRNDQRFVKMKRAIETMQEEILSMKNFLHGYVQMFSSTSSQKCLEEKNSKQILADNFAQTENEIWKKNNIEPDALKLITMVKKCLTDVMKDSKLHLLIDREEENRELQHILSKLAEDREDIKKTIMQAFAIAAEQAKKNYDQFGHIGQDAMHYIAVLNENTNKMLKKKLEETDNRLKEILNAVNRQMLDVDATLANIDGQFDEIFQRVEVGCQRNTEHCEEMAQSLEKTANNWVTAVSELENVTKGLSNDTHRIREIFKEIETLKQTDKGGNIKTSNEMVHYDSIANDTTQDLRLNSETQRNMIFMHSMIHSCWEKMTAMNRRVENGCEDICKLIDALEHKLRSLNESVDRLNEVIQNVHLENLDDCLLYPECPDERIEEVIENAVKSNPGDSGDAQSQIFQNNRNKLANETLAKKLQNVIAIDKEAKMIELILRKVCEKTNIRYKMRENLYNSIPNNTSDIKESLTIMDDNGKRSDI